MSETLFYNDKTIVGIGSVGIGTTNPGYKLVVDNGSLASIHTVIQASSLAAGSSIAICFGKALSTRNCGTMLWNHVGDGLATNYMSFGYYGGDDKLNVTAGGNVGIGKTNPGASLEVSGNIYASSETNTLYLILRTVSPGSPGVGEILFSSPYLYSTINTTHGRGSVPVENIYRRTTNTSAFGPTSNYFFSGTTTTSSSAINLAASSVYDIEMHAYFTKTTAGTVTWTLIASSAPTLISASFTACPVTGIGAGTPTTGFASSQAATTAAFSATGTLTTGVNHSYMFKVQVITNLATTFTLQAAQSAGTMTALAGSYYMVKPVSTTTGAFT